MEALFETINGRRRPEDVAQMILEKLGEELTPDERRILDRAAAGSLKRALSQFTLMMEDFERPVAPERQVQKAVELFSTAYPMTAADCADAEKVEAFIRHISVEIGKTFGRSDFKGDRLNKLQRESAAIDLSKRRYNKLFRHLIRLERKVRTYIREQRKYEFTRISKSSLAGRISWEEFSRDRDSACFIANTIADNDSTPGSGIYAKGYSAQTELTNNIIIAKAGQSSFYSTHFAQTPPTPIIRFNNIFSSGGMAYEGAIPDMTGTNGNKSLDPLFANPTQGDYHLLQGSPPIDAGYNQAPNLPDRDLDGNQRVQDGDGDGNAIINMGAYEFLAPASAVWNLLPRSPGSFTARIPTGVGSPNLLSSISRAKPFHLDWQIIIKGSSLWASLIISANIEHGS